MRIMLGYGQYTVGGACGWGRLGGQLQIEISNAPCMLYAPVAV